MKIKKKLIFVGDARSYHVTDWYEQVELIAPHFDVELFSDLFDSADYKVLNKKSISDPLITIDKVIMTRNYNVAARFRNYLKLFLAPVQAFKLAKYKRMQKGAVLFHAHSFYYILICYLAQVKFVATPMGSDYLLRPKESVIYRLLAKWSIKSAVAVTCDSIELQKLLSSWGVNSTIIQNGINCSLFKTHRNLRRKNVLSTRGFQSLYNIKEIIKSRNYSQSIKNIGIEFISVKFCLVFHCNQGQIP